MQMLKLYAVPRLVKEQGNRLFYHTTFIVLVEREISPSVEQVAAVGVIIDRMLV